MRQLVVSHPFGNLNSYNAALAFHEEALLSCFHTCLSAPLGSSRRSFPALPKAMVHTHPSREIVRLALTLLPRSQWNGRSPNMIDRTGAAFDRAVARQLSPSEGAVYAYEDWASYSFSQAKQLGLSTLYELPTAYFTAKTSLLTQETEREPELARYLPGLNEPDAKLLRKEHELRLADIVICPSTFVQSSLAGSTGSHTSIHVIPYGADVTGPVRVWQDKDYQRPLKLIYAGPLAAQKGLHYLFQSLENLPFYSYILSLAGRWTPGYREWLDRRYRVNYECLGHLSPADLKEAYCNSQVLVLPSLCDGFGLVLLEAMASGIPVIATYNSGAPDVITHGLEGYLVQAGNPDDLTAKLEQCLDDRKTLAAMGALARLRAEELTWNRYRFRLISTLCRETLPRLALVHN